MRLLLRTVLPAATFAFALVPLVNAQRASTGGAPPVLTLEPVRVTADLWESPFERIPASVTVLGESVLQGGGVGHFADLVDQVPNLTWTGGTSRPRYLQIRGVGENSQYEGETPDSAVRFLVDDLDFTGLGTVGSVFDVRQVEVLRGPQAGAFGANAAAGVVRLVTQAPTPFWTGLLEGTAGDDGLRTLGFAVGGPLNARSPNAVMARLAVQQQSADGFRRNVTLDRATNARDEFTARLKLTLNPSSAWRWDATGFFAQADNGFDEFALDNNGRRTFSDQPGRDRQDSVAGSLRGTYTGGAGVRWTTVTSGSQVDSTYSYDDDWTAASYQGFSDLRRDRRVFGQEIRADSTLTRDALGWIDRWTLGAFLGRTEEATRYTNEDPDNLRGLRTTYDARHRALFGQVAHDLGSRSRLTLGLRGEHLELAGSGRRTRFRKVRGTFDPEAAFHPRFDDTLVGGKITWEHELTERQLVFASVTRGYKGGGVNVDARISPPDDPLTYATEYLWNYEAGLRGNWAGGRTRGEVTAFQLERRDTQVRDSAGFGGSYRFFTANARGARVQGLEGSATHELTRAWSLHVSGSLMRSRLAAFPLQDGTVAGGRALANTPRYGYTAGVRYRSAAGWFAQADVVGRARHFDSNNHDETRRSFTVVHGSAGYAWGRVTATVWVRNALDRQYDKRVFFFGNEDPDYMPARYDSGADPRQIGVTLGYRF